jgi:hypothetical protein
MVREFCVAACDRKRKAGAVRGAGNPEGARQSGQGAGQPVAAILSLHNTQGRGGVQRYHPRARGEGQKRKVQVQWPPLPQLAARRGRQVGKNKGEFSIAGFECLLAASLLFCQNYFLLG